MTCLARVNGLAYTEPMIALVAAVAENGIIGTDNELPWHLPTDLKHFRDITAGKTIVMGRKTFDSILEATGGKPLPNRRNVVLTRDQAFRHPGVEVLHDVRELTTLGGDVYVIGGGQVYAAAIDSADVLYMTEVHAQVDGDARFPAIDPAIWREVLREAHPADERNEYAFDFVTYEKIR